MSQPEHLIVFSVCGQEFRLRGTSDDGERVKKVAVAVENMIRERRTRAMQSDLRAAIMTAYELAYELQELKDNASSKSGTTGEAMDRLLERLEKEMGALPSGREPGRPSAGKDKGNRRR